MPVSITDKIINIQQLVIIVQTDDEDAVDDNNEDDDNDDDDDDSDGNNIRWKKSQVVINSLTQFSFCNGFYVSNNWHLFIQLSILCRLKVSLFKEI